MKLKKRIFFQRQKLVSKNLNIKFELQHNKTKLRYVRLGKTRISLCSEVLLLYAVCMGKAKVLLIAKKCAHKDPDQPIRLNVVLTNGQFILPRCGSLMFDNRFAPPPD